MTRSAGHSTARLRRIDFTLTDPQECFKNTALNIVRRTGRFRRSESTAKG